MRSDSVICYESLENIPDWLPGICQGDSITDTIKASNSELFISALSIKAEIGNINKSEGGND